jgi:Tfp pilus assembly protein PilN
MSEHLTPTTPQEAAGWCVILAALLFVLVALWASAHHHRQVENDLLQGEIDEMKAEIHDEAIRSAHRHLRATRLQMWQQKRGPTSSHPSAPATTTDDDSKGDSTGGDR